MKALWYFIVGCGLLFLSACEKAEQPLILQSQNGFYQLDTICGNTEILIYNKADGYTITVNNGPAAIVGCAIRKFDDHAVVYFSDSYIGKNQAEAQSAYTSALPLNTWLELRLIVYRSSVSSMVFQAIDGLGLDFFDGINDYQDYLASDNYRKFKLSN